MDGRLNIKAMFYLDSFYNPLITGVLDVFKKLKLI